MEKEVLGIFKFMEFYEPYIVSSKVYILTDNKNLLYVMNLSKKIQRWKLVSEDFNYELKIIEKKR